MQKNLLIILIVGVLLLTGCNTNEKVNDNNLQNTNNQQQQDQERGNNTESIVENQNLQNKGDSHQEKEFSDSGETSRANMSSKDPSYVYVYSSSKQIKDEYSLSHATITNLDYAKNEIFARHGHDFSSEKMQNYFNQKMWYTPIKGKKVDFSELNEVERKNVEYIDGFIESKKRIAFELEPNQVSQKEIVFNNTSFDDLLKMNEIDPKNMENGFYKYILGKTVVFDQRCDIIITFDFEKKEKNYFYSDIQLFLINDNKIVLDENIESTDVEFTTFGGNLIITSLYPDYVCRISFYNSNGFFDSIGARGGIEIKEDRLLLSSATIYAGKSETGTECYYTGDYELVEENGHIIKKLLNVDYKNVVVTAQS